LRGSSRTVIGAVIFVGLAVVILLSGMRHSSQYFQTVSEFSRSADEYVGRGLRINGYVDPTSVQWDPDSLVLRFRLTDGEASVPVVYEGVAPDLFAAGQNIVVEGKLAEDGTLRATQILVKCPSKYEPEAVGESEPNQAAN